MNQWRDRRGVERKDKYVVVYSRYLLLSSRYFCKGIMSTCTKCLKKEAVLRCKMCHRPICKDCGVSSPAGIFCSDACAQKMQSHVNRVKQIDRERPIVKQKRIPTIIKLIILLAVLWLIAQMFGINIVERIRELVGSFKR